MGNRDAPTSAASTTTCDPFDVLIAVPVHGGTMVVASASPHGGHANTVVLAIHGITSNGLVWRRVTREVTRGAPVRVYAPDLRGRGDNAALPGPYGLAAHVADMLAILDHADADKAVLVGHSMGAYVAARIAAEHPERTAGLVLVDGGTSVSELTRKAAKAAHGFLVGPALARHAMPFMSVQAYLDYWRQHPALADAWNADVEAYVLHDLSGKPGAFRYVISVAAVEADSDEMVSDPSNRDAITRVEGPLYLLRAEHGALGDGKPLIDQAELDTFVAEHPVAYVESVVGVNHYTLLLGDGPGPARVAAAIETAAQPTLTR